MPENVGLYDKFKVYYKDEPVEDFTFTLIPDRDDYAKIAILAYADACEDDLPILAADIRSQYGE